MSTASASGGAGRDVRKPGIGPLLLALAGIFALAFALYAAQALRGGPVRSVVLLAGAARPDGFPHVVRVRPGFEPDASTLEPGDALLGVGGRSLEGASAWTAYAHLYAAAPAGGGAPLQIERDGERRDVAARLVAEPHVWRDAVLALSFAGIGLLIVRRARDSRSARAFALAALVWAIAQIQFQGGPPLQTYAYFATRVVVGFLWAPLMILATVYFPEGTWPDDRPAPRWPWLFATLGLTWTSWWFSVPLPASVAIRANPILGSLAIAAILVVMTRNYARAGPAGRRQVKWAALGIYLGLAPSLVGTLIGAVRPDLAWVWFASQVALLAIPISIYIAVTRSNLLDIDRLISGTGSYTILLGVVGAGALVGVPWLAEQASARAGLDSTGVQVVLAAVLAALVVKLEPRLRPVVERLFFAERRAFQEGIGQLIAEIHEAREPGALAGLVGERLDRLLHPELCVLYARGSHAFAPVFTRRSPITPHFELDQALAEQLAARVAPVELERDRGLSERLGAAEQAALRGLGSAVLVPVAGGGRRLQGFIALGRKASGDVYTSTDLALLGMVGTAIAGSLMRFDDAQLLQEARALQDRLRQYVPASIADELAGGQDLAAGERRLSVLFADLRGYTSLAEGRRAEEIFGIVNRYTETVTRAVTEQGGTVVEFNGDGMMAVFGAPRALADKERRALAAARRIVAEVSTLRAPGAGPAETRLQVGVGLATGSAYVGAIRSVDRHIWSALGNTTNLAARLQALTRELGAPIVIDSATREAVSGDADDFEPLPATAIRGLRAPRDIYVLAQPDSAAA